MTIKYDEKRAMKEVVEREMVSVTCDFCGKEFPANSPACGTPTGSVTFAFGFGSGHDNKIFDGDICDDCFDKINKKGKFTLHRAGH